MKDFAAVLVEILGLLDSYSTFFVGKSLKIKYITKVSTSTFADVPTKINHFHKNGKSAKIGGSGGGCG